MGGYKVYPAPLSLFGEKRAHTYTHADDAASDCSSSIHSDLAPPTPHHVHAQHSASAHESKEAESVNVGLMLGSGKSQRLAQQQLLREKLVAEVMGEILPDLGSYADGTFNKLESEEESWQVRWLKLVGCIALDLHEAVLGGSLAELRRTLRKICTGPKARPQMVNDFDQEGRTALSLAAKLNKMPMCAELLEFNAIVECPDEGTGRTPLYYSVRNRNHELTMLLLRHGAAANTADMQCVTPLMLACVSDDHRHVRMLCEARADVDLQDERGWTALHYAVTHDAQRCLKILLEEGADRDLRDMNRRKPIHFAKFHNFGNCIALLADRNNGLLV